MITNIMKENKSEILNIENPMIFNQKLAKILGSEKAAIVLQQIQYWLKNNEKKNKVKNLHKGCWWTFNTIEDWTNHFKLWSYSTIKRVLSRLRKLGVLITDNFNIMKYDRTLWYTINYDKLNELTEEYNSKNSSEVACSAISSNCPDAIDQSEPIQEVKMNQPIPETTTEIKSKTTINSSSTEEKEEDIAIIKTNKNNNEIKNIIENRAMDVANEDLETLVSYCQEVSYKLKKTDMKKLLTMYRIDTIIKAIDIAISTATFFAGDIKNYTGYLLKTLKDKIENGFNSNANTVNANAITTKTIHFTNYSQRDYDYDSLEKQLLGWDE